MMLKLDSNESHWGASPAAIAAAQAAVTGAHLYPESNSHTARRALAEFLKVDAEQITLGNGSENILELIIKAYLLTPNTNAVLSQYAFITIPALLKSYGALARTVPMKEYHDDIPAILNSIDANTRVVFIVNPNNPTGSYQPADSMKLLLDNMPRDVLVVVDEAYHDFVTATDYPKLLSWLPRYPNLLITRTFSKAYGLAALRLGYAISAPEVTQRLQQVSVPYNVNRIALAALEAALQDQAHLTAVLAQTRQGLQQLIAGLQSMQYTCLPAHGNFVTFHCQQKAASLCSQLLQRRIHVKRLQDYGLPDYIRVTVGPRQYNQKLLETILKITTK